MTKPTKNPKPNKNEDDEREREDPCYSDILEWLQEFRENLVDDRVPESRDSHASSSHELSLEPTRSVDLGKHSVYTRVSRCYVGGRVDMSGHFFIVSNHKVFYDVVFRSNLGRFFWDVRKSLFCEKRICVLITNGPHRWDFV